MITSTFLSLIMLLGTSSSSVTQSKPAPTENLIRIGILFKPDNYQVSEPLVNAIGSAISRKNGYRLVETIDLDKVLIEQSKTSTGFTLDKIPLGNIKTVDFLVYGSVSSFTSTTERQKIGNKYYTTRNSKLTVAVSKTNIRNGEKTQTQLESESNEETQQQGFQECINKIAKEFVRGLPTVKPTSYPKIIDVDTTEKVIRLNQGLKLSLAKSDIFEIGYEDKRMGLNGDEITVFKVVCACKLVNVEDDISTAEVGEQGRDRLSNPIWRSKPQFLEVVLKAAKEHNLIARLVKRPD